MPRSSKVRNPRRFDSYKAKEIVKRYIDEMNRQGMKFPTHLPLEFLLRPSRSKCGGFGRPPNGYLIYRKDIKREITKKVPNAKLVEISKISSERWKIESPEIKNFLYGVVKSWCTHPS